MCKSVVVQNVTPARFRAPKSIRLASGAGAKMNVFLSYQLGDDLFFSLRTTTATHRVVLLNLSQPDLVPVNMNVEHDVLCSRSQSMSRRGFVLIGSPFT